MKTEQKMLLAAAIACGITLLSYLATGCSGDDDTRCMSTEGCIGTDAGPLTADADPTMPDANLMPDANGDPCAPYQDLTGDWTCWGTSNIPFYCNLTLVSYEGQCGISCEGHFGCEVTPDMTSNHLACETDYTCSR